MYSQKRKKANKMNSIFESANFTQRLLASDYRLKFTRRLCGGTINMKNKPNYNQFIHSFTHILIHFFMQNKPNYNQPRPKSQTRYGGAETTTQYDIRNTQYENNMQNKPNCKTSTIEYQESRIERLLICKTNPIYLRVSSIKNREYAKRTQLQYFNHQYLQSRARRESIINGKANPI